MDAYKKSYYNKKFSNDLNFALQGKRAAWLKTSSSFHFLHKHSNKFLIKSLLLLNHFGFLSHYYGT